jgi:putative acetyltransferase
MEFIIRPAKVGDAAGINELRRMPGVFENILGIPSEHVKTSEDFIANADGNTHLFVAVTIDGKEQEKVIGVANINVSPIPRMRHSGSIGMMIHKDYQGMGVGNKLLETLLDMADNWLMLVRVELTVFIDNEKAIGLYKKHGFVTEGIKKKTSIRNGEYIDEYMMAKVK